MSLESIIHIMSRALEGLGSLPWGVHAVVALAMAAGLVVWLTGQRWVRPIVVILGAGVGAMLGSFAAPLFSGLASSGLDTSGLNASSLSDAASTIGSGTGGDAAFVYRGLLIGLVVGAVAGLLLYRSAMALALGVVMGALLPLAAATVLHFWPLSTGPGSASERVEDQASAWRAHGSAWTDEVSDRASTKYADAERENPLLGVGRIVLASRWSEDRDRGASGENDADNGQTPSIAALAKPGERVRAFAQQVATRANEEWNTLPASHQAIIAICAILGLACGVIAGMMMPKWGATACTAMFGSAVWLVCFVWLSNAMGAPWRAMLDHGPVTWLCVWGGAAFTGMIAQWTGFFAPRKKPASGPKPAPAAAT